VDFAEAFAAIEAALAVIVVALAVTVAALVVIEVALEGEVALASKEEVVSVDEEDTRVALRPRMRPAALAEEVGMEEAMRTDETATADVERLAATTTRLEVVTEVTKIETAIETRTETRAETRIEIDTEVADAKTITAPEKDTTTTTGTMTQDNAEGIEHPHLIIRVMRHIILTFRLAGWVSFYCTKTSWIRGLRLLLHIRWPGKMPSIAQPCANRSSD